MTVEGPAAAAAAGSTAAPSGSWLPILLYPAGFPLSVIVLVWAESEISLVEIVRPIVAAVVASLAMTVLLGRLARDRRLGAMAASAIWIALIVDRPEARLILVAAAIGVVLIGGLRRQGSIVRAGAIATRLLALIATIVFAAALLFAVGRPSFLSVVAESFLPLPGPAERPTPPPGAPDIFVYLLDGYPGRTAVSRLSRAGCGCVSDGSRVARFHGPRRQSDQLPDDEDRPRIDVRRAAHRGHPGARGTVRAR